MTGKTPHGCFLFVRVFVILFEMPRLQSPRTSAIMDRSGRGNRAAKQIDRENLGIWFNLYHWLRTDPDGDLCALVRDAVPHLLLVTVNGAAGPADEEHPE